MKRGIRKRTKSIFVCFTGIDGSGKSTLAKDLVDKLNGKGIRSQYVYNRFEPVLTKPAIILGKVIFFQGKGRAEDYHKYSVTRNKVFKNTLLSVAYHYLTLFDYWWQIMIRVTTPLKLGKNIICDRYIYDMIIEHAIDLRYSDKRMEKMLSQLLRLLPKPEPVFLMDVSEEVAFQRKKDTPSIDFLKERRKLYLRLGERHKFTIIDGSQDLEESKHVIQDKVFTKESKSD